MQIASGADIIPIKLECDYPFLQKGNPIYDASDRLITYTISQLDTIKLSDFDEKSEIKLRKAISEKSNLTLLINWQLFLSLYFYEYDTRWKGIFVSIQPVSFVNANKTNINFGNQNTKNINPNNTTQPYAQDSLRLTARKKVCQTDKNGELALE